MPLGPAAWSVRAAVVFSQLGYLPMNPANVPRTIPMTGTVITVTSGKGGVGKTTTTSNLAAALAPGRRVVAVDADIGLRNLDLVMGLENRIIMTGRCGRRPCELQQALVRDPRAEFFILAARCADA